MQNHLRTIFTCIALLALVACSMPGRATNPTPNATSIIETAVANANATLTAMAVQVPTIPSNTPVNTPGPVITETPSATQVQIPIPTNSPQGVWLTVSEDTNCRTGPGTTYDRVGGIKVGQSAEVVGRDQASQHWYIRLPDDPVVFCWVIGFYATVIGNVSTIPAMTPPPTPTASATTTPSMDFTVAFLGIDSCVAWFLEFNIVNTGAFVIESVKIVTKDLTTPNTFTATYDKFEDWNGCLIGTTQMDLTTGESEKTNSGATIPYNPAGHNFEATVTACTQNGQAGTCLSKKISFTP